MVPYDDIPSYRSWLREEYEERRRRNPSYSIRAYGRDLGITHGQLSKVLSGKGNLSAENAEFVASNAFSSHERRRAFPWLVKLVNESSPHRRKFIETELRGILPGIEARKIEHEELLLKWYHLPIMDLCCQPHFDQTPQSIASHLGITATEATEALGRLLALGLLENVGGRLKKTTAVINIWSKAPSSAIRAFHRQMINKALASIDDMPMHQRQLRGLTISINKMDLPQVVDIMDRALTEIYRIAARSNEADSLHQICLQIFDLQNPQKGALLP